MPHVELAPSKDGVPVLWRETQTPTKFPLLFYLVTSVASALTRCHPRLILLYVYVCIPECIFVHPVHGGAHGR